MSLANFMWWCHGALHCKNSAIVPGGLLAIAVSLVVFCHTTQEPRESYQSDPLKTFLCMVLVQMIPLVALELKIMSCADPVGLFCKFAVPVTMVHVIFLVVRFAHYESYGTLYLACSAAGCVGAVFTLLKGFHWSPRTLFYHKSVWGLTIMSVLAAGFSHWLELFMIKKADPFTWISFYVFGEQPYSGHSWRGVLDTTNSYMEILAFVPAVWMVFREDKSAERAQVEEIDTKRTSTSFFLFLVGFYLSEDLVNAWEAWESGILLATVAHIAHFLLLLDFACFILAHIYNPEKLMGDLRKWLPVDLSYDV